jgi:Skp family chaperone for outer membrane proteins
MPINKLIVAAILVLANALPVAYLGMKAYDALRPQVQNVNLASVNYNVVHSDVQLQIQITQIEIRNISEGTTPYPKNLQARRLRELEAKLKKLQAARVQEEAAAKLAAEKQREIELENERRAQREAQLAKQAQRRQDLIDAAAVVGFIFVLTLGILWGLSKLGGSLSAEVKAVIERFGGKVWITAVGVVGAFLAIAMVGVAAVYLLATFKTPG